MARDKLRNELRLFLAWATIGLLNTLIHIGVVVGLVELFERGPVTANCAAFVTACTFSFFANSQWAFRLKPTKARTFRFIAVSLIGLATSVTCSTLVSAFQQHYLLGVLWTIALLPLLTFLAHRFWTWRDEPS